MAVGQSGPSLSFIDRWGDDAPQFVEYDFARVRLTDPSFDASGLRDTLTVTVSSVLGTDSEIVTLIETGKRTGVFEGGIDLRINGGNPAFPGILETFGPSGAFDSLQVDGPNGLSDNAQVVPSILRLVDDQGDKAAAFAAGGRVFVRLVDRLSDTPNPDTTTVTITTSSGDSEVLTLVETSGTGGEFTGSIPGRLAPGTPAPGDGVLDALAGETLTASHEDVNHVTSSTDTVPFAGATIRFVDARGVPTSTCFEQSRITLQVIDTTANLDPLAVETVSGTLITQLDNESMLLHETGASTGVFEGRIYVTSSAPTQSGDGRIRVAVSDPPDPVQASYSGANPVTLRCPGSSTRLLDVWGNDAETFPRGGTLTVRVEDPSIDWWDSGLQTTVVEVRSLTTGDVESLFLDETGVGSNVYEGTIALEIGAAVPGDRKLQAQVEGEVLEARHNDWNLTTTSMDTGRLSLSEMWFLDENSRATDTVLENTRVSVRLFDGLLPPSGSADVTSENANDGETLFLAPYLGKPGFFEGSIPMQIQPYSAPSGDGVLGTRTNVNSLDGLETIIAWNGSPAASATARAVYSEIDFVDANGNPVESYARGEDLHVRLRSGLPGTSGTDQVQITLLSPSTGDEATMTLAETGPDTNVYQGSYPTGTGTASPGDGRLQVRTGETIMAEDHRADWPLSFTLDRATITASRVTFVDRNNAPTDVVFRGGRAYLEAFDVTANTNPDMIELFDVTVFVYAERDGHLVDTEAVTLTETGPATALFRGSIPLSNDTANVSGALNILFNPASDGPDRLLVRSGDSFDTAEVTDSVVRFVDDQGNDVSVYAVGDQVRVRLLRAQSNLSPSLAETTSLYLASWLGRASSSSLHDTLFLELTETGPDTGVFEGQIAATAANEADRDDNVFQVYPGGELQVSSFYSWSEDADRAYILDLPNQPPVAVDDTVTTSEDTSIPIDLLTNDSDPEDQPLSIVQIIPYGSGGLQTHPDGTMTYIPDPNYNGGPEIFVYEVSDGLLSDFGTLQVFITPVNDPPTAAGNSATVPEDSSVLINVLANDSDVDGDTLSIASFTQGTKGSVSASGGSLLYTPNPNANGADSFTYTIEDPSGATATATVSVTITAVNDPPVATADSFTINEDGGTGLAVLANDFDVDGDSLTISAVTQGSHGSVTRLATSVFYIPVTNYFGTDSFTYTVSDGKGGTATATVSMTINSVNDVPVTTNDSASTNEDTPVTVSVLTNDSDADGDPLTITSATNGTKGAVTVNAGATVTYTPNLNANGVDSFTYTISDGRGGTKTGTVTITIVAVNDPPSALSDARTTPEDTAVNIAILANDSDPENQTLTVTAVTQGTSGSVVLNADKTVTYTPNFNFVGVDLFSYTISDGTLTATANVSVSMTAVNDPPYAVEDGVTLAEDETITINVLANDSDVEGDQIYVSSVLPATHGVASYTPNPGYTITYTPKPNFNGEDFFVYKVRDTSFGENSATVMITVTPVDDPPVAVNDAATVTEDSPATAVNVLANDTDVDGGPKSIDSVTQPANGTVVITGGGTGLTYQPNANYCNNPPGTTLDTFTYTLTPGGSTATVTMTVTCADDAPAAVADAASVNEDSGANTINVQANDTDVDGGPISIASVTQPANGTVVITNGGADLAYA
ncbi:MAG TPA: Ig-like domain-containing protein, partial [Thermoanaerobaculia bacterium]|nr:Ig-like domain-containing protein [Thermoanaerobaculia bacterium]